MNPCHRNTRLARIPDIARAAPRRCAPFRFVLADCRCPPDLWSTRMPSFRLVFLAGLAAAFAAAAAWADDPAPVAPFQADYEVLRNGKELGRATLTLRPAGDGTWEFNNQTKGTKGMASLLGVDVVEKSTFRWHDGQPEGLHYSYSQEAAIKSRERSTEFDWRTHEAQSRDGKNVWTAPLQNSAIDRNLVTVALMARLKS